MSTRDRRREPRIETDLAGSLQSHGRSGCRVVNLSRNGALAISTDALPEHATAVVRLEAARADGSPLSFEATAAVVRCVERPAGDFEVALFFLGLNGDQKSSLENLIRSYEVARNA